MNREEIKAYLKKFSCRVPDDSYYNEDEIDIYEIGHRDGYQDGCYAVAKMFLEIMEEMK